MLREILQVKGDHNMNETQKISILQMARGAIMERADYEVTKAIENILDANTSATAKRKITITLELNPDDQRRNISLNVTAKSALAPTNPVVTSLYIADGGMWKLRARETVKAFLEEQLAQEVSAGTVTVAL